MSMFLTLDEIEALTERSRKKDQIEWLQERGIPYLVGANGHPRVSRAYIESLLSGRSDPGGPSPNFSAIAG